MASVSSTILNQLDPMPEEETVALSSRPPIPDGLRMDAIQRHPAIKSVINENSVVCCRKCDDRGMGVRTLRALGKVGAPGVCITHRFTVDPWLTFALHNRLNASVFSGAISRQLPHTS